MKRTKRLTRKERNAQTRASAAQNHIHCVACGRHIDAREFTGSPVTANFVRCQHGSRFASCRTCVSQAMQLLAEHDRSGTPVRAAAPWH